MGLRVALLLKDLGRGNHLETMFSILSLSCYAVQLNGILETYYAIAFKALVVHLAVHQQDNSSSPEREWDRIWYGSQSQQEKG